jgi:hypothetical protein
LSSSDHQSLSDLISSHHRSAWLSSAVMGMLALRLGGWMLGMQRMAFEVELLGGLVVFAAYIIFDTQVGDASGRAGGPGLR